MVDRLQQTLDPSLLNFALETDSPEPIWVIAEVASSIAKAAKQTLPGGFEFMLPGVKQPSPKNAKTGSKNQPANSKSLPQKPSFLKSPMDDLAQEIKRLKLAQDPVRLDSAEAFVLEVTPEQLQKLARSELVGRVRPNREHHVGATS